MIACLAIAFAVGGIGFALSLAKAASKPIPEPQPGDLVALNKELFK